MSALPEEVPPVEEPKPENPDAEPDEPEQDEPEPETPSVPSSETVMVERDKKLTAETKRHENALAKIYGDDWAELQPCPLCLTDGYVIPAPPGAFPDDQWFAVEMAAGKDRFTVYEQDPTAEICPTCKGWGKLDTGAKTGEQAIRICPDCTGNGWQMVQPPPTLSHATWTPTPPPPARRLPGQDSGEYDQWGRPAGHERFGIDIQFTGNTW